MPVMCLCAVTHHSAVSWSCDNSLYYTECFHLFLSVVCSREAFCGYIFVRPISCEIEFNRVTLQSIRHQCQCVFGAVYVAWWTCNGQGDRLSIHLM